MSLMSKLFNQEHHYLQILSFCQKIIGELPTKIEGVRISLDRDMGNSSGISLELVSKLFNQVVLKVINLYFLGGNNHFLGACFSHVLYCCCFIKFSFKNRYPAYLQYIIKHTNSYYYNIRPKRIMIDHHQHMEQQHNENSTNPTATNNSTVSQFISQAIQLKKQTDLSQLLKSYVKQSISIHRERLERVEQSNQILSKQYRALDTDLDKLKDNKNSFNKELDAMIGMLKQIDRVEAGVMECERNGKLIFDLIGQIEKKITVKIQKKIQNLEKLKKNKK